MTPLPEFRRGDLAKIKRRELGAVVVLDVGGKVAIGTTADPRRYARHFASTRAPCEIVAVGWTLDTRLARRIRDAAETILSARKVGDAGLFDVPERLAVGAVEIAARNARLPLQTTKQVLAEIWAEKERKIERLLQEVSRTYPVDV